MSGKNICFLAVVLILSQFRDCECYIVLEPEKTGDLLLSFSEHKQFDNNALNGESTYNSAKVSESRTSNGNQTLLKQNQLKKVNTVKQKSCYSCSSGRIPISLVEEQYRQRLEYIKQQILFKLGMNKAPKPNNRNIDSTACNAL